MVERFTLISEILTDAYLDPAHAKTYGAATRRVAVETREAIDALLNGRPLPQGAFMWPYTYANGRRSVVLSTDGRPDSLGGYISNFDREHG